MKPLKKVLFFIIISALITGCSTAKKEKTDVVYSPVLSSSTPEVTSSTPSAGSAQPQNVDAYREIWDSFSAANPHTDDLQPEMPTQDVSLFPIYLSGLNNSDPYIRWYSANKALEFLDDAKAKEMLDALNKGQKDKIDYVQKAMKFADEAYARTFNDKGFIKSPDNKLVAFNIYQDSRYNDGMLWVYDKSAGHIFIGKKLDGSITSINWSPNSNKVCSEVGGRIWSALTIVDLVNVGQELKPNVMGYLTEHKSEFKYKIGVNNRPDPYEGFIEWSPDGNKVLLSYQFTDDDNNVQGGYAVFNCQTNKLEKVVPVKGADINYTQIKKPDGFKW